MTPKLRAVSEGTIVELLNLIEMSGIGSVRYCDVIKRTSVFYAFNFNLLRVMHVEML